MALRRESDNIEGESDSRVASLCDRDGRPIGRVVEPTQDRLVGRGAGTVLLVRRRPVGLRDKTFFALG